MGIDYSIELGYGLVVESENLPPVLKHIEDDPDTGAEQWLKDRHYNQLEVSYVGNYMCGDTYLFFHVPSTRFRGESHYLETLMEFNVDHNNFAAELELRDLATELGVPLEKIGWKLISNVS
jgi:hypothetical protein